MARTRAFLFLLGLVPLTVIQADSHENVVTKSLLNRLGSLADAKITGALEAAACGPNRPDGFSLYGGVDFAQLLPATRASGASVSLTGAFRLYHPKGADHLAVQVLALPSAGYTLPLRAAAPGGRVMPADAGVGMTFNCQDNPHYVRTNYFVNVGASGLPVSFAFAVDAENLFVKAFMASDKTNRPRDYGTIISRGRSSEAAARQALRELVPSESRDRLLFPKVPRWSETDPPEGKSIAHWTAETAKAVELAAGKNLPRQVEDFLLRLKRAGREPLEQGKLQLEVLDLYEQFSEASAALAKATFPLVISADRREILRKATEGRHKHRFLGSPTLRELQPPRSKVDSLCASTKKRFYAVYYRPAGTKASRRYLDCLAGNLLTEGELHVASQVLGDARNLVEKADEQRAALGDLFHLLNNTYAQYLQGQAVSPESIKIGGVNPGKIFTGCYSVALSVKDLVTTGSALVRGGTGLAQKALASNPTGPTALAEALSGQAKGFGLPTFNPYAGISYPYKIGAPVKVPLDRLPVRWRNLLTGNCPEERKGQTPSH